jgi:hypothetical protein
MPLRKSAVQNALPAAACYHPLFIELLRTQMQWELLVTSIDSCTVMPEAALQQRAQVRAILLCSHYFKVAVCTNQVAGAD